MLLEVEHVKAHRSMKKKLETSLSERFVTEGNQRAEAMAKVEAILDGGAMA